MRRDRNGDQHVAGRSAGRAGLSLALETDLLTGGEAGRNLDLHLLAVGQMNTPAAALGGFRKRNGDVGRHVATTPRRREIFELAAGIGLPRARRVAEHVFEDVVDAAEAAAASA